MSGGGAAARCPADAIGGWDVHFAEQWDTGVRSADPLAFPGYADAARDCADEAVRTGVMELRGRPVAVVESRYDCLAGTMSAAVGERVVRAFRRAADRHLPVVATIASGGVRLQEGMLALIQMGRTAAAVAVHAATGLPYVAVLRSPTTGGVLASWGSLADLRAASPGAVLGFAGPRVVEAFTGAAPTTSHTAQTAYGHGLVDAIVPVESQLDWVRAALGLTARPLRLPVGRPMVTRPTPDRPWSTLDSRRPSSVSAWATLTAARAKDRPSGLEWAAALCSSWVELHGRDPVIRAGLADIAGHRVVVIAMDRHANGDGAARPGPDAYRLAQRAIVLAGKYRIPVLTLIDTPGAEPGGEAENDGLAAEIAHTLSALTSHPAPTVSLCVGEGGSGGAYALGHTDRALMLDDSAFCVIGPEAASAVLRARGGPVADLAVALRITAAELRALGVVDVSVRPDPHTVALEVDVALSTALVGERERRTDDATHRALGLRGRASDPRGVRDDDGEHP